MDEDSSEENWTAPESTNEGYPTGVVYSSAEAHYPSSTHSQAQIVQQQYQTQDGRVHEMHYAQQSYPISSSQHHGYHPATSTYGRMSPIDYREMPSGSDAVSSYTGMHPAGDGACLMNGQHVDSSTVTHSGFQVHQVVMQNDHRVVSVQRVTSPVDCTVSQSALSSMSHDPDESQRTTHALLTPVPVSDVHGYSQASLSYSSSNEVSTTAGSSPMLSRGEHDRDVNQQVSSLNGSLHNSRYSPGVRKERHDSVSGEPDTTQDDSQLESYRHAQVQSYILEEAHDMNESEPLLHSTMVATPDSNMPHPRREVMDATLDSTQLSHPIGIPATAEPLEDRNMENIGIGHNLVHLPPVTSMVGGTVSMEVSHLSMNSQSDNKENTMSYIPTTTLPLRKSTRIAELINETPSWQKPKYKPKPYNPNEIWCEDCMTSYNQECLTHKLTSIPDKVVLSRAWASLPPMLQIYRLPENDDYSGVPHVGVFAKRQIARNTQFGPFIGELVSRDNVLHSRFPLALERPDGDVMYFETSEENKCNWMMFVRPADNFAEQNMVAYQYGLDIYFSITKTIEARGELKVWYAAHYAERFGFQLLPITEQDIQVLDDIECKFQCYECPEKFRSQMALQRHIMIHEAGPSNVIRDITPVVQTQQNVPQMSMNEMASTTTQPVASSSTTPVMPAKKRGRPFKKDLGETYMWKKKSTSIYLSKTLKKYQKRREPINYRNSLMTLYKKKSKESGGNEWVCNHCDLTFDNSNLLNLHTLTHAAEDIAFDEVKKFAITSYSNISGSQGSGGVDEEYQNGVTVVSLEPSTLACPVCCAQFTDQRSLIEHAAEHGTQKSKFLREKSHKCDKCWKSFLTSERLQRHLLCHDESSKPLQCQVCYKKFMNNSALSCHMKIHSDKKYYSCPVCDEGFEKCEELKAHVVHHSVNGIYTCPYCQKQFEDFYSLRKHMRAFHTNKTFPCPECDKVFPRPDKLKLHMLRHSTHREFMCETCGRQFKRKDKLKDHIRRMHTPGSEHKQPVNKSPAKKFTPKVSPTDYHRFIYKCHLCMLGFKRRGMLVNHLAKRHPEIKPETVPELNLPILKTQKDYYCNYCDKVYKSSSKRKSHILKNHPGSILPMSARKKPAELPGVPNPTYSQTVGSITTMPHSCEYCHKQYASKAKLTQHQRKKHPDIAPPPTTQKRRDSDADVQPRQDPTPSEPHTLQRIVTYDPESVVSIQSADGIQAADLLTQAMSELTQSLQEYRQPVGEYHVGGRSQATMVQVQHIQHPHSTIELSNLIPLSSAHFQTSNGGLTTPLHITLAPTPTGVVNTSQEQVTTVQQGEVTQNQEADSDQSATQAIVITPPQGNVQAIPVSLATNFITRGWPNTYQQFR